MAEMRDFGRLQQVTAEAIGQPGQRRFRLRLVSPESEFASLWLEKEQLAALGEALETALQAQGYRQAARPPDDQPEPAVFPLEPDVEIRVAQLSMGVDPGERTIFLIASDSADSTEEDALNVRFGFDYRAAAELRAQITQVVSAGRPPCRLCGGPLDPGGHVCVRSNGHHPH